MCRRAAYTVMDWVLIACVLPDEPPTRHVLGTLTSDLPDLLTETGEPYISSPVVAFEAEAGRAVTESGRRITLRNRVAEPSGPQQLMLHRAEVARGLESGAEWRVLGPEDIP